MPDSSEQYIDVRVHFDKPLADPPPFTAKAFVEEIASELLDGAEGGGPWGMGHATVVKVERLVNDGFGRLMPETPS